MKNEIKLLKLTNRETAQKFIDIDDVYEKQYGQSLLGETKPFLKEVLEDTKDSIIPNAFSNLLDKRLTGKLNKVPK